MVAEPALRLGAADLTRMVAGTAGLVVIRGAEEKIHSEVGREVQNLPKHWSLGRDELCFWWAGKIKKLSILGIEPRTFCV